MHQETEKRKFKENFQNKGYKKGQNIFFYSEFCFVNRLLLFRWPVKIVKLREWQKKSKIWKQSKILNCKPYFKNSIQLQN